MKKIKKKNLVKHMNYSHSMLVSEFRYIYNSREDCLNHLVLSSLSLSLSLAISLARKMALGHLRHFDEIYCYERLHKHMIEGESF